MPKNILLNIIMIYAKFTINILGGKNNNFGANVWKIFESQINTRQSN